MNPSLIFPPQNLPQNGDLSYTLPRLFLIQVRSNNIIDAEFCVGRDEPGSGVKNLGHPAPIALARANNLSADGLLETSMNQDESIALWRRGKDAWNAWAEDMLRQKAELRRRAPGTAINHRINGATKPANGTRPRKQTCPACAS